MHHHERALALGDVVAEVLLRALLGAHEVQQVVLDLEREAGVQAVVAQRLDFDLGAAADDGADGQGHRAGVMRGLVRGHDQVVFRRDVVAAVTRPSDVERLAFDGAAGHVDELGDDALLRGSVEVLIRHHRAVDEGQREVARVDGQPHALGEVHARLAAAKLGLVGDVVVDEGRGMKVLDGGRGAGRARHVTAHGATGREADERAMALAAVLAVRHERLVQVAVHVRVRALRDEGVHQVAHAVGVRRQVLLERLGRFFYGGDDFVDCLHSTFSVGLGE